MAIKRTDMHCHQCSKNFVAQLDYGIDGDHVIECPHCGHEHCRVIKKGVVTSDRWSSRPDAKRVKAVSVWKAEGKAIKTSTASAFIRDRWLNSEALG